MDILENKSFNWFVTNDRKRLDTIKKSETAASISVYSFCETYKKEAEKKNNVSFIQYPITTWKGNNLLQRLRGQQKH